MADENGNVTTLTTLPGGGVQVETVDHAAMRARAKELRWRSEQDAWDLSEVLYDIWHGAVYQMWGFTDWKEYVESELEFKISKAQQYVAVQEWVRLFAPDFVDWVKIMGITKARLMKTRLTPENAAEWQPRLDGKTYRQIEAILLGEDPDAGGDGEGGEGGEGGGSGEGKGPERADVLRFALFPAQRRNVDLAVERAKVLGETDKDGVALDYICTAFLSTDGHYKKVDEHFAAVERSLGVRLVAFKQLPDQTYKVTYGKPFMDELMEVIEEEEEAADEQKDDPKGKK
jgi:hypothetical protein